MAHTHRNLASERVRLGMNQTELAREFGVSIGTIVRYEADIDKVPSDFVKRAADFFGCTTDYLLDMTEERIHIDA